jgi:hypothetical protein
MLSSACLMPQQGAATWSFRHIFLQPVLLMRLLIICLERPERSKNPESVEDLDLVGDAHLRDFGSGW